MERSKPCVYFFIKDREPLYIGSSSNGIFRVSSPTHHKSYVRAMADEIRIVWFATTEDARQAEREFIKKFNPRFNGRTKGNGTRTNGKFTAAEWLRSAPGIKIDCE